MDWKEKMKKGMELIKQACFENEEWNCCADCPFTNICDAIIESDYNKEKKAWDMYTILDEEMENR